MTPYAPAIHPVPPYTPPGRLSIGGPFGVMLPARSQGLEVQMPLEGSGAPCSWTPWGTRIPIPYPFRRSISTAWVTPPELWNLGATRERFLPIYKPAVYAIKLAIGRGWTGDPGTSAPLPSNPLPKQMIAPLRFGGGV